MWYFTGFGHRTKTITSRLLLFALALPIAAALSGCGAVDGTAAQPQPPKGSTAGNSLPAVTQPAATPSAEWPRKSMAATGGVSYSYSYPPDWSADLVYCPNSKQGMGSHLPAGCAGTDFLFGQKAQDVNLGLKSASSKRLVVAGKQAIKQVDTPFDSSKAARTYTILVYGNDGAPVFGFVTYIGPGTSQADQMAILANLDSVAASLAVETQP